MRLLQLYPQIAAIDCALCAKQSYDLETGELRLHAGKPIPIKEAPCVRDPKVCKKVKPGYSDLTPENREIYEQYLYFREIGRFPDDEWVQRWKSIIEEVEDSIAERRRMDRFEAVVLRSLLRMRG